MQSAWNQLIDDYIALGEDPRSKEEIERNAKIGTGNGALFRVCQGSDCRKVESNGEKFSYCAQCKTVRPPLFLPFFTTVTVEQTVYCSKACQKASWATHRAICKSGNAHEQLLPSQKFLEDYRKGAQEKVAEIDAFLALLRQNIPSQ